VRARMNQELMQLYKQEKVNPMAAACRSSPRCRSVPLYTLFANAIELRTRVMLWIHDLSLKDPTYITPILMTRAWSCSRSSRPRSATRRTPACSADAVHLRSCS